MNTLPRAMTVQILTDSQTYYAIRQHWSKLMNSERRHELSASHHFLYLALLGKDWRKGFTCVSNPNKLANGAFHGWNMFHAFTMLHIQWCEAELLAPFDGLVTSAMLQPLRRWIPNYNGEHYRPQQFVGGNWPFEAYILPDSVKPEAPEKSANA